MIRNNYHNKHLNTAMSLNMAFALAYSVVEVVVIAAVVDILQIVFAYHVPDNMLDTSILEVRNNNTFILSPFFLNIFNGENECDILYICTSGSLTRFFLFFKRNLRFFSYK